MRIPRRSQDSLRTPLNSVLGTAANVRLVRALALADTPVAAGELARRAQLGRTSIYPALASLERTGIVEFVGAGAQRQARFRKSHPLGRPLQELFRAEARRIDALIGTLRDIFRRLSLQPIAAWLEGAAEPAGRDDTLLLCVLADPQRLAGMTDRLSEKLSDVERKYGVQLAVLGLTRSELESRAKSDSTAIRDAVLLDGVPPLALLKESRTRPSARAPRSQADHDVRARRLAVAIATKLKWDPGLVDVARRHAQERARAATPGESRELAEWSRLLSTMSAARIQRFLVDEGERATRLRQTLPALGLLTPAEREAVLASETDREARAAVRRR